MSYLKLLEEDGWYGDPQRHVPTPTVHPTGKNSFTSEDWALAVLAHLQNADWGIPTVWISDRDPKFVRGFWRSMFNALRVALFFAAGYIARTCRRLPYQNCEFHLHTHFSTSLLPYSSDSLQISPTYTPYSLFVLH
ncbi:hypothetical protein ACN38_g10095 [Penicillium nordicum]|uniref:Uncharacterized protein n=1 Tax=Penicillium nordicum TaxID=229535 RepID=A0A0M9WBY5_9EURO|nr:hypothetical protein ACN38_g10095 [Penicillium nordicum]